jgi:ATP-dependent DNA ligase
MIEHTLGPRELRAVAVIPEGPEWLYEPKWDGFRALAQRDGESVELFSKNGQPLGRYFPEIVAALRGLPADGFSLDGELVVPLDDALSFDALQQRIHPAASRVALLAQKIPARYLVFDVLRRDGLPDYQRPLRERRQLLEQFASGFTGPQIRLSPAVRDLRVVQAWLARAGGALDGVVAKRLDLAYLGGTRDGGVKIKQQRTADCVIGGFRFAVGTADRVGSLLLGLYDAAGLLDYVGFCSAFPLAERHALVERLLPYRDGSGFSGNAPDNSPSRWSHDPSRDRSYIALRPELVLEVAFDQVTSGRIRHGTRPLRWRSDKSPLRCTADQLEIAGTVLDLLDFPV